MKRRVGAWERKSEEAFWEDIQERINFIVGVRKGLRELLKGRPGLDSLLGRTDYPDMQVIAVDNGSSDGTPEMLSEIARRDSRLIPVLLNENRGIPGGRQQGLERADGEFILFLDNDTEIEREDFLQVMVNAIKSHPNIGSTGAFPNIYTSDNDDSLIQCVHVPGIAAPVA